MMFVIPEEDPPTSPGGADDPVTELQAKRTQQQAFLLMIFMIVGMNSAWLVAQSQTSDVEVNKPEAGFRSMHTFEVPDMMLMARMVPTTIDCQFVFDETKEANSTDVSWSMLDSRGNVLHQWSGQVGEDCSTELQLSPGMHRVSTTVPFGVQAEQTVHMQVWKGLSSEGYIIATVMAILFPLPAILVARRKLSRSKRVQPLARLRRLEDWQAIHREMEELDRTAAEINDLQPYLGGSMVSEQLAVSQPVLNAEADVGEELEPDIPQIDQTELIEDMELDTLSGLEDPLAADNRIQRVGDIYDLMKED